MSALALAVVCGVTAAAVEDVHFFQLSMKICQQRTNNRHNLSATH
jgi:hypothetical protein